MLRTRREAPNYNSVVCEIDHDGDVPARVIESLPMSEAHPFRHRCAGCAYLMGLNEARDDIKELIVQVKALTAENEQLRSALVEGNVTNAITAGER